MPRGRLQNGIVWQRKQNIIRFQVFFSFQFGGSVIVIDGRTHPFFPCYINSSGNQDLKRLAHEGFAPPHLWFGMNRLKFGVGFLIVIEAGVDKVATNRSIDPNQ